MEGSKKHTPNLCVIGTSIACPFYILFLKTSWIFLLFCNRIITVLLEISSVSPSDVFCSYLEVASKSHLRLAPLLFITCRAQPWPLAFREHCLHLVVCVSFWATRGTWFQCTTQLYSVLIDWTQLLSHPLISHSFCHLLEKCIAL